MKVRLPGDEIVLAEEAELDKGTDKNSDKEKINTDTSEGGSE